MDVPGAWSHRWRPHSEFLLPCTPFDLGRMHGRPTRSVTGERVGAPRDPGAW